MPPILASDRARIGHWVFPLHPTTAHDIGVGILAWIDPASPMAETDVRAVVDWVCGACVNDGGRSL